MLCVFRTMGVLGMGLITSAMALAANGAPPETAGTHPAKPVYTIVRATVTPALDGAWEGPAWKDVQPLDITHFYRTDLSDHRPRTQAKAIYDDQGIYIHFRVEDRYVRAIETEYHGKVWEDACVEFFVQPRPDRGYFNFEMNCGGTLLLSYQENKAWKGTPLREPGAVPWSMAQGVRVYHSMPKTVEPENPEPVTWQVEYFIPFDILEAYLGELGEVGGQTWRANFYKCAENNSHPHWASWALIEAELNFHRPEFFSEIRFEK